MEDYNVIEDNPTRRVSTKGLVMATTRSMGGKKYTGSIGKYVYIVPPNERNT